MWTLAKVFFIAVGALVLTTGLFLIKDSFQTAHMPTKHAAAERN